MILIERKYVLVACPIFDDNYDVASHLFKGRGEFIQARYYDRDGDIDSGLYGILWGKVTTRHYKNILNGKWAIVKTEVNENLVTIDAITNEVRFKRGIILYIGKITSCAKFILKIIKDSTQFFIEEVDTIIEEQIMGTRAWKNLV